MTSSDNLWRDDPRAPTVPSALEATDTAGQPESDSGTPLYDELAATHTASVPAAPVATADPALTMPDFTQFAVVLDLFRLMKQVEDSSGGRNGRDIVVVLSQWLNEFGINTDDEGAAARSLRAPAWLASALTAPAPHEPSLIIHVRTDHRGPLEVARAHLAALVQGLGTGSSAAVFDVDGDQIAHIVHPAAPAINPAAR